MIRRLSTSLLAIIAVMSAASIVCHAQSQRLLTRHVRDVTLNGQAQVVGRLPATETLRLVVVLPLRNQAQLDELLKQLYDPSSPSYRQFLTVDEFTARFGPSSEDYSTVVRWAESIGFAVVGVSRNRLNLDVTGSVATIEAALHVKMDVYQHPTEKRTFYAPDREPIVDLPVPLWQIAGLDNYAIPKSALVKKPLEVQPLATTGSCPEQSFCGSDMRAAYYEGTALTGSGQSLGLLEFAGTDLSDLNTYYTNAGETNTVPITLVSVDGTSTSCVYPSCDDTEQTLDMTQALGMAPGLASLVMYIGSTDAALLNGMATASPLNAQLSSSWYWPPPDPNTDNPYFEEFAAQGQSFFEAAGDGGKWTGTNTWWPMESPLVICVGGTSLETSSAGGPWASETAWVDGGGGISPDKFDIPFWQVTTAIGCSDCSTTYRNGPDVSANSDFTFYVCADQQGCTANFYGGTSFATPMWAGYLALVNQQAASEGQSTVGFINPMVYNIGQSSSYETDFHDITSGSNGYPATAGYDLATGWGSPNAGTGLINAIIASDFFVSGSPASQTVLEGKGTSYTETVTSLNGFSGTVNLSSSCPSGITCTLSASSVSVSAGGTATFTLTASARSSTGPGTYNLAVTGTSGSLTHTALVALVVVPPFSLSSNPTAASVKQGGTVNYVEALESLGGFRGSVTLSVTGCPSSSSCAFSRNPVTVPSVGSVTSTFSVATGKKTPAGIYTMTLTGITGSFKNSVTVTLNVIGKK